MGAFYVIEITLTFNNDGMFFIRTLLMTALYRKNFVVVPYNM